jgi:hypothetical protein
MSTNVFNSERRDLTLVCWGQNIRNQQTKKMHGHYLVESNIWEHLMCTNMTWCWCPDLSIHQFSLLLVGVWGESMIKSCLRS